MLTALLSRTSKGGARWVRYPNNTNQGGAFMTTENQNNKINKSKPQIKLLGLIQIFKQLCKSIPAADLDYERWEHLESHRRSNPEISRHEMRNH